MVLHWEDFMLETGELFLPGPSAWWKDYDLKSHRWVPDRTDTNEAKRAFELVTEGFDEELPEDWKRLARAHNRLHLKDAEDAAYLF